jgi:hypothetical protein
MKYLISIKECILMLPSLINTRYSLITILVFFALNKFVIAQSFAIPPKFDRASSFSDGVAHVVINNINYYIDKSGKVAITPDKFDRYSKFTEGLAGVGNFSSQKEGFIDKTGKLAIPMRFSRVHEFKDGRAVISFSPQGAITSEKGVIDRNGKYVRNPHLEYILDFNEGFATANFGIIGQPTVGMIDLEGKTVLSGRFTWMSSLNGGLAAALVPKGGWGLVRTDGTWAVPPKFDWLGNLDKDYIAYGDCNGKIWQPWTASHQDCRYGYIDRKGEIVIPAQFTYAGKFNEDRAIVSFSEYSQVMYDSENKSYSSLYSKATFGYIDRSGRLVIDPIYQEAGDFINGAAVVVLKGGSTLKGPFGYIDINGKPVTRFIFEGAYSVSEGLAAVKTAGGKWGYLRFN